MSDPTYLGDLPEFEFGSNRSGHGAGADDTGSRLVRRRVLRGGGRRLSCWASDSETARDPSLRR